jgi:hypothetical protein
MTQGRHVKAGKSIQGEAMAIDDGMINRKPIEILTDDERSKTKY